MLRCSRSCGGVCLAVMRAGTSAAAFFAAMAHNAAAGVRHCAASQPNGQGVRDVGYSGCCYAQRPPISHQRGGSDGRTSATTQIVKTLHSCLDATRLYRAVSQAVRERLEALTQISSSSASGDLSRRLEEPWHSCDPPRRGLLPGTRPPSQVHWRPEGSVGAT